MRKRILLTLGLTLLLCLLALSGLALSAFAEGGVADASQMAAAEDVTEPGMEPVYALWPGKIVEATADQGKRVAKGETIAFIEK